ncbi:uncharacterized protein LOC117329304 isoform X1 [Pecten maximus]|uniref:uncharacterized protein LOC117329304 isoform X1 n=1 Tax=Pecten maximus TaxID=6579 RepID=UPI001458650B|nr:uncharacterized protein LOC117329304 isoform X1 [Pecten maximus]XP_033743086.1 uncharacterized protein LOC117329304 isoform X1 [Pecten maximus]XP_033743087.1 uncharacterized protein LOC117329304 isoform X1 [Pecten maximus]
MIYFLKNNKWSLTCGKKTVIRLSIACAFVYGFLTYTVMLGHPKETIKSSEDRTPLSNLNSHPHVVLGMLTPHTNTKFRDAQRSTWISTILRLELPFRITYKFLIDRPTNDTILENKMYDDIVFLNATSQGRGVKFGEKMYLWFKYIYENFPDALLGGKVDDDVFLCVPQIFTRLDEMKSTKLYYGWSHGSGKKVNTDTRMDEMFVVLGRDLIERIAKRSYCTGTKCNANVDLIDTNFGGTSIGSWLSIYKDIDYQADNKRIVHMGRGNEAKILTYIKPDFCSKYILNHKSSVEIMKQLQEYNNPGSAISSLDRFVGAVTGSMFSGDVVRTVVPQSLSNPYKTLAVMDKMPACDNWAVVTTIFAPSKAVKDIASLSNWCLVIVADKKTPQEEIYFSKMGMNQTTAKGIKYLSVKEQRDLYPLLSDVIPLNHFGRKNIGYMYAIHHKAKYIWDFDDDNDGTIDLNDFKTDVPFHYVTLCEGKQYTLVNPYPYFGVEETYTWPRGFPLQDIKNKTTLPILCNSTDPIQLGVVQSLANQQPDIDAVYRMTRDAPFNFRAAQKTHRPFVVPGNTYAPFNAQATLWLTPAFPYLALPISVNGRVSDIWRSYIAQYFLHRQNVRLAFSPPYVTQERNAHNSLRDFNAELDIYQKVQQLVSFLSSEQSSNQLNIVELYKSLYMRKYLEELDIRFVEAWTKTLESIG